MKWKKMGKLFDPTNFTLLNGCTEFAQSPQTIVFSDFIRIYFSTRKRDDRGEYISLITYVDMDISMSTVLGQAEQEVIALGELGTFDEHGIFPISPFVDNNDIYAFTCGWSRRVSVPVETSIGVAISKDQGKTFKRLGNGPILSSSIHEPTLVGDGFVKKYNGVYHMWYIFGTQWIPKTSTEPVARVYKIGHATSTDIIHWDKEEGKQIIPDVLNKEECQALPSVVFHNGVYHMVFCFREATDFRKNPKRGYRLGYAFSEDLINWTRKDSALADIANVGSDDWDTNMMCYPHLFSVNNKVFLLYNGNEFGKYGFGCAALID